MIGTRRVPGSLFRILQTSSPGIFGSMRSRIIKPGFSLRAFSSPTAPSGAVEVVKPALRKLSARRSTTSRSSSMIRTVFPDAGSMTVRFIAETVSVRQSSFSELIFLILTASPQAPEKTSVSIACCSSRYPIAGFGIRDQFKDTNCR